MESVIPSSPSRLVLFDIDGTLLTSAGAASRLFGAVLGEVACKPVRVDGYSMAGKTDGRIVRELLARSGFAPAEVDAMVEQVLARYLDRFPLALAESTGASLFPGVRDLLTRLAAMPEVMLGLLTGNLERGAAIKLDRFGLGHLFRVGAYGSDSEDRRALVPLAVRRAQALTGVEFAGPRVVIVGDTPLDIDCGRAAGASTVAVATGPFAVGELLAHEPDAVFADFSPVEEVVAAIMRGGNGGAEATR